MALKLACDRQYKVCLPLSAQEGLRTAVMAALHLLPVSSLPSYKNVRIYRQGSNEGKKHREEVVFETRDNDDYPSRLARDLRAASG